MDGVSPRATWDDLYPVSPLAGPSHPEQRLIHAMPRTPGALNLATHLRNFRAAMRATGMAAPATTSTGPTLVLSIDRSGARFAAWLAPFVLGAGAYGTTFRLPLDAHTRQGLEVLYALGRHTVVDKTAVPGDHIVMKVGVRQPGLDTTRFIQDNVRESTMHKYLAKHRAMDVKGCAVTLDPRRHIPEFFAGFLYAQDAPRCDMFVTYMGLAPGATVFKVDRVTTSLYLAMELAAATLWSAGVAHGDLHKGNMMYDASTNTICIIDFGYAILLTQELKLAVRRALARAVASGARSLGELWLDKDASPYGTGLLAYTDAVMRVRDKGDYNPDAQALTMLYNALTPAMRARVPDERRVLWGAEGFTGGAMDVDPLDEAIPMRDTTSIYLKQRLQHLTKAKA